MCPICLTTAVALAAGAGASSGVAAWMLGKCWRRRTLAPKRPPQSDNA